MMIKLGLILAISLPAFGAYANGYTYRRTITVQASQITGTLTDFPVLVSGTYSYLATVANGGLVTDAQGDDVVFTASDGTTALKHEIEIYTATTGLVTYWVKVPSAAVSTVIYIYYGNSAVTTNQSDPTNVWDANFKSIHHLRDGSTLTLTDSTANAKTFTNSGVAAATGKIDGASSSTGGSSEQVHTSSAVVTTTPITISFWLNTSATSGAAVSILDAGSGTWNGFYADISSGNVQAVTVDNGFATFGFAVKAFTTGVWQHVVAIFTSATSRVIYVNGVAGSVETTSVTPSVAPTAMAAFAAYRGIIDTFLAGSIDEIRISDIARSADWTAAEYNSSNSPSTFYAIGSQETSGAAGFRRPTFPVK